MPLKLLVVFSLIFSCKTSERNSGRDLKVDSQDQAGRQHQDHKQNQERRQGPPHGEKPNADQIFTLMDADKNNLLELKEVKGPLKNDFSKVDADGDGFITKEELNNAPKPERGVERR